MKQVAVKGGSLTARQASKIVRDHFRSKPYTAIGLSRVVCVRCDRTATQQWSLRPCAIGKNGWYPLCDEHDIELNRIVMEFLRLPDAEERLEAYKGGMAA